MVTLTRVSREAMAGRSLRFDRSRIKALIGIALILGCLATMYNLTIRGLGPFPSGAPVELFIALLCLHSLWSDDSQAPSPKPHSHRRA